MPCKIFRSAVLKSYWLTDRGRFQTCYVKRCEVQHVTCSVDTWIVDPGGEYSMIYLDPDDVKRMKLCLEYYHHTRCELTREAWPSGPSSTDGVLQSTADALKLVYIERKGGVLEALQRDMLPVNVVSWTCNDGNNCRFSALYAWWVWTPWKRKRGLRDVVTVSLGDGQIEIRWRFRYRTPRRLSKWTLKTKVFYGLLGHVVNDALQNLAQKNLSYWAVLRTEGSRGQFFKTNCFTYM